MPSAEAGEAPIHDGPERDFPLGVPGFTYQDLHRDERLADLDRAFLAGLAREDADLAARLASYRQDPASLDPLALSRLLVEAARHVSRFVARLFGIETYLDSEEANVTTRTTSIEQPRTLALEALRSLDIAATHP